VSSDLLREIKALVLAGATHIDAPTIGEEVFGVIDASLARFIGYSAEYRHTHLLWMAHCWAVDCWPRTPRLLFVSPEPNCGKTTALEITQCFVPRSPKLISNLTEAAFYKRIEDMVKSKGGRPTILHDQLDKLFGNAEAGRLKNPKVENLIETGFQRSGTIERMIKGHTKSFNVYAPVALAGAMDLSYVPDAIISRSLIIRLQRALKGEVPEEWNEFIHAPEIAPLCQMLRWWIELIYDDIPGHRPDIPEGLINRDIDKWRPVFTMADLAGGPWPERARVASVASVAGSEAGVPSRGLELLWTMKDIFDEHGAKVHTETVMPELADRGFRWAARPIQESSIVLAGLLRPYGVKPRSVRIGPKSVRGFRREWFEDTWLRYPPPAPDPEDDWDDPSPPPPGNPPHPPHPPRRTRKPRS
jgi:hypothetical protein